MLHALTSLFFLALLTVTSSLHAEQQCVDTPEPLNVWFFLPGDSHNLFWRSSRQFAEAVADDLRVNARMVVIEEYSDNRLGFEELIKQTMDIPDRELPDAVISILYGGGEFSQISLLHKYSVPFLTFNTSLDENVLKLTGLPRTMFPRWIEHISPDEQLAGGQLVDAIAQRTSGKTMAILAGPTRSTVNSHRVKGAQAKAGELGLEVIPPVYTDWTRQSSERAANVLLQRIPDIDMLWTAGPDIAQGAIDVLRQQNSSIVVGSFDWSKSNIELIKQQHLTVSFGGHFMEAGWALIMAYDYLRGANFIHDTDSVLFSELKKLDSENVSQIERLIINENWRSIDFSAFSKCLSGNHENYDFSLQKHITSAR